MSKTTEKYHTQPTQNVNEASSEILKKIKKEDFNKANLIYQNIKSVDPLPTKGLNRSSYKIIFIDRLYSQLKKLGHPISHFNGYTRLFNGKYWIKLNDEKLAKFLSIAGNKMELPPLISRDVDFIIKCVKQLQMLYYKDKKYSTFESSLNFLNGTLKIENGEFKMFEHSEDDLITYILPYGYDPEAKCEKFQKYLDQVIPDVDKQLVLAEFIASVFSNLKHEKILILLGKGANGKSVFLEISRALLGEFNVSSFSLESLTDSKGYHRAELGDSLLNYAGEISTKVNPDEFKKLASGEPTIARSPREKPFEIKNYGRLAFNCNHLPDITDNSNGFFRRFLIIPFDVSIPTKDQNKNLAKEIIEEELPGIMNWILEGLKRLYLNQGFTECQASNEILEWYKRSGNSIESFIQDSKSILREKKHFAKEMYKMYLEYCKEHDVHYKPEKTFYMNLKKTELHKARNAKGIYYYL